MRQNEDERDEQDELAQAGQQQADLGLTQRHKALLAGDLDESGVEMVFNLNFIGTLLPTLLKCTASHWVKLVTAALEPE